MLPKVQSHIVQFAADNTDVFGGTFGAQVPTWFQPKLIRVQVVFSDTDLLFSLRVAGIELCRNSGPHRAQADNVQQFDWQSPHICFPFRPGSTDFNVLLDANVVTGGVGMAIVQWEG